MLIFRIPGDRRARRCKGVSCRPRGKTSTRTVEVGVGSAFTWKAAAGKSPCSRQQRWHFKGVITLPDPLAVAQIELRQIIDGLERSYRLRDVNALVLIHRLQHLKLLRRQLDKAQAAYSRARACVFTSRVHALVTAEVLRWWIETSMIFIAVLGRRLRVYVVEGWYTTCGRSNSFFATFSRHLAVGVGGGGESFAFAAIDGRKWPPRTQHWTFAAFGRQTRSRVWRPICGGFGGAGDVGARPGAPRGDRPAY